MNWKAGAVMIFAGVLLAAQILKGGALDKLTSTTSSAPSSPSSDPTVPQPSASQAALGPSVTSSGNPLPATRISAQ